MGDNEELSLGKDDRLPWLEPVDSAPEEEAVNTGKIIGFAVAAVVALIIIFGGLWWVRANDGAPNGNGALITAPEGAYKVRPKDVGGMDVEGQGDASFAASEGADASGKLDLSAQPETPVNAPRVAEVRPETPVAVGQKASAPVASGGKLAPPKPTIPAARPVVPAKTEDPAAGLIQLGAYATEASAQQAHAALARRFAFLAPMHKIIAQTSVGGTTFYRLRVTAGPQAAQACAQLKAGGANCLVVK